MEMVRKNISLVEEWRKLAWSALNAARSIAIKHADSVTQLDLLTKLLGK